MKYLDRAGMLCIVGAIIGIMFGGKICIAFLIAGILLALINLYRRPRIPLAWVWGLSFLAMWLIAGLWTDFSIFDVWKKVTILLTETVWYIVIPPVFVKNTEQMKTLIKLFFAGGLFLVIISIPAFLKGDFRLETTGVNEIGLGRYFGVTLLCLLYYMRKRNVLIIVPASVFTVLMLLSTGSKGPFIASIVGIVVLFRLRFKPILICVVLGFGALQIGGRFIDPLTLAHIRELWTGLDDPIRTYMYRTAFDYARNTFFGWGIGYFGITGYKYPHNYILETFMEVGWLPGLYLIFLLGKGFRWLFLLQKQDPIYRLVLAIYSFEIVLGQFTGDITGIDLFYIFLTLGAYHFAKFHKSVRGDAHGRALLQGINR